METKEKLIICNKIKEAVNEIYDQIKLTCENVEKGMFAIKEINTFKSEVECIEYTIELVSRVSLNTDDYGVIYSLMIEEAEENISIITDITRSYGEVLYSKNYILQSKKATDIFKDIKEIPLKLFQFINR